MYDTILVPHDGSDASQAALAFATGLPAERYRLLRVDDDTNPALATLGGAGQDWRAASSERMTTELREAASDAGLPEGKVELVARFGDPAEVILEEAAEADLIVMSTHGRGATGRLMFGSTADRVSRHGLTPTVLLRGRENPAPQISRIVVALDGSTLAETAVPVATRLARVLGEPIHLVRVVDPVSIFATFGHEYEVAGGSLLTMSPEYDELRTQREREAVEYLREQAATIEGVGEVMTEIRTGTPSFALLELVRPDDLLVMTSHGHGGIRRWLIGSVAEKLVREAKGPVLLVPAREPEAS